MTVVASVIVISCVGKDDADVTVVVSCIVTGNGDVTVVAGVLVSAGRVCDVLPYGDTAILKE